MQPRSENLRTSVPQFHRYIRQAAITNDKQLAGKQTGVVGPWELSDLANMDQTPLEFCFNTKGVTYTTSGDKTIWTRTTGSGHDKRQCTVQLTVFADGEPKLKPLLIFKGTGKRIPEKETKLYDSRVVVKFQDNAWCDEEIMIFWIRKMWNCGRFFDQGQKQSKLLVYDEHCAQTTEKVQDILKRECNTTVAIVLPGATSKVQPLDFSV